MAGGALRRRGAGRCATVGSRAVVTLGARRGSASPSAWSRPRRAAAVRVVPDDAPRVRRAGPPGAARRGRRHRDRCTSRARSGTPVVGLFGPTDPARNGPFAPRGRGGAPRPACAPCHRRRLPEPRRASWTTIAGGRRAVGRGPAARRCRGARPPCRLGSAFRSAGRLGIVVLVLARPTPGLARPRPAARAPRRGAPPLGLRPHREDAGARDRRALRPHAATRSTSAACCSALGLARGGGEPVGGPGGRRSTSWPSTRR